MITFCLSTHHLWGGTMQSYKENADDGYINAPLRVALRILADLKQVLKDYAGLELNMLKTQLLVKGISMITPPTTPNPLELKVFLRMLHASHPSRT